MSDGITPVEEAGEYREAISAQHGSLTF
jgi:hypothetical protein